MIAPIASRTLGLPTAPAAALQSALQNLEDLLDPPPSELPAFLPRLESARSHVAQVLNQLDPAPSRGPWLDAVLATADCLNAHPAAACAGDDSRHPLMRKGWLGAVAQIFAAPAWQTPDLRPLDTLPVWLWTTYARHLFAGPAFFHSTGEEIRWAAHIHLQLDPLVRMLTHNRGSEIVKTTAALVLESSTQWPAVGTDDQRLLRQQSLGQLRTLLAPRLTPFSNVGNPMPGHPLRVALITEHLASGPGIYERDRLVSLLDLERVELTSFVLRSDPDNRLPDGPRLLPESLQEQIALLREPAFDAVIFAGDIHNPHAPLAALALHRVANRQFAATPDGRTTGLPHIDIFLGDAAHAPAAHTERLAVLPAALAFERFNEPAPDESAPTRADLGLPEKTRLLVATLHPLHFTAETRAHWQLRLEKNREAQLIVLPDATGPALQLLLADLAAQFGDRLIAAGDAPLASPALAALLAVCDEYLPGSAPGDRLHLDLAQRLHLDVADAPARIDGLAFADALAAVLELACHQPHEPLVAPAVACDLATRHEQGNHLLAFGRADRAVVYLLAAVEDLDAGPDVWHDLALALHANGQPAEAIQAMETCVRRAPGRLDSWLILSDWASDYGQNELVRDIAGIVRELAPADPRVTALAERIAV